MAGDDQDNSGAWSGDGDVTARTLTTANLTWVNNGSTAWSSGNLYQTPAIDAIVQEIVDRPGWDAGNAMSFIFWDNGTENDERVGDSYEGGYPATLNFDFEMPEAPIADFTISGSTTICEGESVSFNDNSSNDPTSWDWDFGDGGSSSDENPTHTYTSAGTYTVILTATNSVGSNVLTMTDYITVLPLPTITASSDVTICDGETTTISGGGGTSYDWDNGLGSGTSHDVSPTTTTTYTVTGSDGTCENTATVTVTVTPLPTVTTSGDIAICDGESTTISAGGATTYDWDEGLGAGSSHDVSPTTTTTYTVTGTENDCDNTATVTVTVDTQDNPGTADPITACVSDASIDLFDALSGEDAGGFWTDDDASGGLSGSTLDATGLSVGTTYSFTYTHPASGACEAVSTTTDVTITDVVTAGTITDLDSLCIDDALFDMGTTLTGESTGGTWSDDDASGGLSGTDFDASVAGAGVYNFTYFVDGGVCGTATETVTLTVVPLPTLTVTPDSEICEGDEITISASGATDYDWDNGLGAGEAHTITPTATTTYTVTGTEDGCSSDGTVTVTVNPLPVVLFDPFDPDHVCLQGEWFQCQQQVLPAEYLMEMELQVQSLILPKPEKEVMTSPTPLPTKTIVRTKRFKRLR